MSGSDDGVNQKMREREAYQGVLARVVDHEGVLPAHEDLARVFVHRSFRVRHIRNVFDDNGVIRVLAVLVQQRVGPDHVVNDVALGNFLGAEAARGVEVQAVVVAD